MNNGNPMIDAVALIKTIVIIGAGMSVGWLAGHYDELSGKEAAQAISERVQAEHAAARAEFEKRMQHLTPDELRRAQEVERWGEARVQQMEAERAEREAARQTRTFGEALADRIPAPAEPETEGEPAPAPEPAAQPERRVMSFDTMGAERQRAAAQAAREQRENTGTEQLSD